MNENKVKIILALMIFLQYTHAYFVDFDGLSGGLNISSGTIIKRQNRMQKTYYFDAKRTTFQSSRRNLQQQGASRFEYYYGKSNKQNYFYNFPAGGVGWVGDLEFQKSAINQPEMQGVRQMYLAIGIPRDFIEVYYIPFLKMALNNIDYMLSKNFGSQQDQQLFFKTVLNDIKGVKAYTDYLVNTFLKDVRTIVSGVNNNVTGKKLFISTDNMTGDAENTYIYNGNGSNKKITGKNIMRTKRYEFNFDEIDAIMRKQITKCIKIIDQ